MADRVNCLNSFLRILYRCDGDELAMTSDCILQSYSPNITHALCWMASCHPFTCQYLSASPLYEQSSGGQMLYAILVCAILYKLAC